MPNKRLSQTQSTSDESTDLNPRNTQIDEKYLYDDQIDTLELEDELEESEEDDETYVMLSNNTKLKCVCVTNKFRKSRKYRTKNWTEKY